MQTFRYVAKNIQTGRILFNEEENRIHKFNTISETNDFLKQNNLNPLDYEFITASANKLADLNTIEKVERGLL